MVSQVNRALLQQAEKKMRQHHYQFTLAHNSVQFLQKNVFALVAKGINTYDREGESIFCENISIRMCYTPMIDRCFQTVRVIAYLTTPGTPAVDTVPVDSAFNPVANWLIQTVNEDACKVLLDRTIALDRDQGGALKAGTKEYPGAADFIPDWLPGGSTIFKSLGQAPASLLTFKIPINRKLTYASNTLLLGNNQLNIVVIGYEAVGTLTSDNIARVETSLTVNFKDAP